jgi:flagellar biosynthesis protein FlhB
MAFFDDDDREQRTEEATPRRRQEAREKGQVALSVELIAALVLIGWLAAFAIAGGGLFRELGAGLVEGFVAAGELATGDLEPESVAGFVTALAARAAWSTVALIAPLYAISVLLGYGQIGFGVSTKAVELDPSRLDPMRGLGRLFGLATLTRTLMSFAKLAAIAATVTAAAWSQAGEIVALAGQDIGPALAGLGHVVLRCTAAALAAILALALLDVLLQRRRFEQDLRMTKQEVREELRSTEGDPQVKARIRRLQREMSARRMMADVPKATVVVTNPTHYAVALRYDRGAPAQKRGAPRVVAKGVDAVAQRIKEVARESGVALYEDVPLARALHARCEIGDEVPVELYQAVAEVLAYVYGLESKRAVAAAGAS